MPTFPLHTPLAELLDALPTADREHQAAIVALLIHEHAMPKPPEPTTAALEIVEAIFSVITAGELRARKVALQELGWLVEQMQYYTAHCHQTTGTISARFSLLDSLLQSQGPYWLPLLRTGTPDIQARVLDLFALLPTRRTDLGAVLGPLATTLRRLPAGEILQRLAQYLYRLVFERRSDIVHATAQHTIDDRRRLHTAVAERLAATQPGPLHTYLAGLLLLLGELPLAPDEMAAVAAVLATTQNLPPHYADNPFAVTPPSRADILLLAMCLPPRQIQHLLEHPALTGADRKAILEYLLKVPAPRTVLTMGVRWNAERKHLTPPYCNLLRAIYASDVFWEEWEALAADDPRRNHALDNFFLQEQSQTVLDRDGLRAYLVRYCDDNGST